MRLARLFLMAWLCAAACALAWPWTQTPPALLRGVIWQPSLDDPSPEGPWDDLGVDTLFVQWLATDNKAWAANLGLPQWELSISWEKLLASRWSRQCILGLAGEFELARAREDWQTLARESREIALGWRGRRCAWYAPIEISPDWAELSTIRAYLAQLPRPLWVSIYRSDGRSPSDYVRWVESWLPRDVGVFYQDGVGAQRMDPQAAAADARALADALGHERVALILEAFDLARRDPQGRPRSASLLRLLRQLEAYRSLGLPVYVFSTHTLGSMQVFALRVYGYWRGLLSPAPSMGSLAIP